MKLLSPPPVRDEVYFHQFERLFAGEEGNPHRLLGLHYWHDRLNVIRVWRPGARYLYIDIQGATIEMERVHPSGLFEKLVPCDITRQDYRIYHTSGELTVDPYTFLPTVGELDQHLFSQGTHYELYRFMGSSACSHEGILGTRFLVWAPNAKAVFLIADFNHWDSRVNPMRSMGMSGLWEFFVPGVGEGLKYKYQILTYAGETIVKTDPFANQFEMRPSNASIVTNTRRFAWSDQQWMETRESFKSRSRPMHIYEVHLGSWKRSSGNFLSYRELAHQLVTYCREMGFTHVELLPVMEHPLDESWGYQVTGFFAPTSRFGSLADYQYFVNTLHQYGIGVILDWVPGHFPCDSFSLARFDGTALYEHEDSRQGMHPHWNTCIFNYGRKEVSNFLIANALFWLKEMHADGLRVDAVASMLYLDYGREDGNWIPNSYGGRESLEAIEFLKHLNSVVQERCPGALMIAEESTSFPGVTAGIDKGGLGFDLKWNMGWMNDTLRYMQRDPVYRSFHQEDLTFGQLYAHTEKFILPLSHDEVVHGKGSLLSKMPGDEWQRFAQLRLLYSYMICQPGKKLFFMGGEIGQWNEWNCKGEVEWFLLKYLTHGGLHTMIKELNHFSLRHSSLWERDHSSDGFYWVDFNDHKNCAISYLRKSLTEQLLCVHNFTTQCVENYHIPLRHLHSAKELFNSDALHYGGSDKRNFHPRIEKDHEGNSRSLIITLAPLATMIFEVRF